MALALVAGGTVPVRAQTPAPAPAPAASVPPVAPALPPADEVLKKYRAAIGGEEAIRKYTARSVKGTFEIPAQGMKGDLSIMAAAPDLIRVLVTLPGLGELQRGYNGKLGWSIDPAIGPRLLEGNELAEFKHSAEFYEDLHEPAKFKSIKVVGKTLFEGQDCYELKLVHDSGFEYTEFFSVGNWPARGRQAERELADGLGAGDLGRGRLQGVRRRADAEGDTSAHDGAGTGDDDHLGDLRPD